MWKCANVEIGMFLIWNITNAQIKNEETRKSGLDKPVKILKPKYVARG